MVTISKRIAKLETKAGMNDPFHWFRALSDEALELRLEGVDAEIRTQLESVGINCVHVEGAGLCKLAQQHVEQRA